LQLRQARAPPFAHLVTLSRERSGSLDALIDPLFQDAIEQPACECLFVERQRSHHQVRTSRFGALHGDVDRALVGGRQRAKTQRA
jgi:hypothetical protein